MGLREFNFYDIIRRNATLHGSRPAWYEVDDGRSVTFKELNDQVIRLAGGLQQAGVVKGDRIGVVAKNSLEFFLLYGASAALGAILLPVNWRLSAEEAVFNLNDGQPVAVFIDPEYEEMIDNARDRMPSVKQYYDLKSGGGKFQGIDSLMSGAGIVAAENVATDDGFVIIHTAAVAGRPRGALLSHGNIWCVNTHLINLFNTTPRDVHFNLLPLFHIAGLAMATASFHAGALNVNMRKFDAPRAVDLIGEKDISLMFDFSPILGSLLEEQEKTGKDISALRAVIGLEAPETIEKYQDLTGGTFHAMYGQTETSALATVSPYNTCPGSAGQPVLLGDVQCVDEDDQPVSNGDTGEIVMRGPMVFKGYWNLPEDNTDTFRNGWHHTGDMGRFDENGFLFYAGRKPDKELIKPGGENVYPAEVEKVILEHPAVEQAVVFGVPDLKWKEAIKAVCRLRSGAELTGGELAKFVGERIASYKKPKHVEFVEVLPLKEDGVVDRLEVKKRYGGD
jgi:acyl-CoA synthetase (AMP-forming)/AMP-acid ligase II